VHTGGVADDVGCRLVSVAVAVVCCVAWQHSVLGQCLCSVDASISCVCVSRVTVQELGVTRHSNDTVLAAVLLHLALQTNPGSFSAMPGWVGGQVHTTHRLNAQAPDRLFTAVCQPQAHATRLFPHILLHCITDSTVCRTSTAQQHLVALTHFTHSTGNSTQTCPAAATLQPFVLPGVKASQLQFFCAWLPHTSTAGDARQAPAAASSSKNSAQTTTQPAGSG
jgi:hypothetical protein